MWVFMLGFAGFPFTGGMIGKFYVFSAAYEAGWWWLIVIGNLAALAQKNVKRMLAYSSVSQAGFMLIAIAADNELGGRALLFYLIPYGAASVGAFAVVAARERELGREVTLTTMEGWGW